VGDLSTINLTQYHNGTQACNCYECVHYLTSVEGFERHMTEISQKNEA